MRAACTVVCVVGDAPLVDAVVAGLGSAPNVSAVAGDPPPPPTPAHVDDYLREAGAIFRQAASRHCPYALIRADPLLPVREAWRRRFAEGVDVLEEFAGALGRAQVDLPDYYLVLHRDRPAPGALPDLDLEWYAGLVRGVRPSRVVLVPAADHAEETARRACGAVGRLPAGAWWPPLRDLLEAVRRFVPATVSPEGGIRLPAPKEPPGVHRQPAAGPCGHAPRSAAGE